MSDDALEGAVDRDELDRFKSRNPSFAAAATRLQETLGRALNRPLQPVPGKSTSLQSAIFFLGHQAADDFFDIVLLAVHGYGMGALKLLRPLFERVVTALYLMERPDQVSVFNDYGDIHAGRFVKRAKDDGFDLSAAPVEWLTEVEKAYETALPSFTDARGRVRGSWTELNLEALAKEVGLARFYPWCALWPTMQLHSTRIGLDSRLRVTEQGISFTHEPQPDHADYALKHSHDLSVYLLNALNRFFGWNLDMQPLVNDVQMCWGTTTGSK